MLKRVRILVSYDGTDYCGWQKQKDHEHGPDLPSLQETIEQALQKIFNHPIGLNGSGRTDAGVHAMGQVCDFETERALPKDLCWALKSKLPPSIVAKAAWEVPLDFHSTLSSTSKTYKYWVWNNPRGTALLHRYSWWVRTPLDTDKLNAMAAIIKGEHDFASFRSMGTPVKHTRRIIYGARWHWRRPSLLEFEVTGNGFMKQMVRNLVGTQIDLAWKGQPIEKMKEILDAKDRQAGGPAAPPQGLFLYRVQYPHSLDSKCRRI